MEREREVNKEKVIEFINMIKKLNEKQQIGLNLIIEGMKLLK